jgi:archaellum component FlaC
LGLDFSSAAIKTKGFGGFLEDVIQKTGGSEVEITKLFGSVDALKALMPLINDDLVRFNQNLDNQKNATGAAKDAADIMGQTVSSQISQIVNNISTLVRSLDQVLGPAIKGLLAPINAVLSAATAAVAKLSEMGMMARARAQATEEMGGVNRRGRFTGDVAARDARALELFEAARAQQAAAAKPPTVDLPENNIISTGGGVGGGKSKGKTPLERQQEAAEKISANLKDQTTLAGALTEQERAMLQLKIDQANIDKQFPLLSEATRDKLKEQLETLYAKKNVVESIQDQQQKEADAIEEANRKAEQSAKQLKQFYQSVADTIQAGIVDGIMGAIDGTKSLKESLSGLLKSVGRMFLNQAIGSIMPKFGAEGGYASGATNAVIGEAGPEYVIPESKMRESMARYARGARGSAVIPENGEGGTNSEGEAAASNSLDVRFNVERINSVDYVTASEFQAGMRQAAAQGAQRGQQAALRRLQQSPSTRRRVGI